MGPTTNTNSSVSASKGYQVSRLATDGSNWAIWKRQTLTTLSAHKGVKRHIEGLAREPPAILIYPGTASLTGAQSKELTELELRWDEYNQKEARIEAQILTSVPESITLEIQDEDKAATMWQKLCAKHEDKALSVRIDVRHRIYALKCEDEANVRTHLEAMKALHEQLNGMGEKIEAQEYVAVILASLPKTYRPIINVLSLQSRATPSSITAQVVMETVLDEFDHLQIEEDQLKSSEMALTAKGKA